MKLNHLFTMGKASRAFLIAALTFLGAGALKAANFFDNAVGTINLGNASGGASNVVSTHKNWAIFALSGGVTITDPVYTGPGALVPDLASYDVLGNVGMAGAGTLTMSASWIKGSTYSISGTQTLSGWAYITNTGGAGPTVDATYLNTAAANATSASAAAASAPVTPGFPSTVTTLTLNATPGANNTTLGLPAVGVAGATYVVNLTNLILSNSILTLNGTSSTNFVFNISQYMTLSSAAKIQYTGTMDSRNVLFNVKSAATQYDVTLSGGSVVNGIILAPTRNVKLTGASAVYGEVIAKGVSLSGVSKVINPFVSP